MPGWGPRLALPTLRPSRLCRLLLFPLLPLILPSYLRFGGLNRFLGAAPTSASRAEPGHRVSIRAKVTVPTSSLSLPQLIMMLDRILLRAMCRMLMPSSDTQCKFTGCRSGRRAILIRQGTRHAEYARDELSGTDAAEVPAHRAGVRPTPEMAVGNEGGERHFGRRLASAGSACLDVL